MDFSTTYKIKINPVGLAGHAAAVYTSKVNSNLTKLTQSKVGKILLDCIRFHGKPVEISPYAAGACNSGGGWSTQADGTVKGFATYSPDAFAPHSTACAATRAAGKNGLLADEILFHELTHAFRGVSGKWKKTPVGFGLVRYDDSEEFLAVMLTNIYISDCSNKKKSGLRADHKTFAPLKADYAAPFGFFASSSGVLPLVKDFVGQNHGMAVMIGNSGAPFNPVADYMASPDKAEETSRKAVARNVADVADEVSRWATSWFH